VKLAHLREALHLKHVDRAGWHRIGLAHPESVAAHSWGVALLVLLTLPSGLDKERALTYAILHDLAEARTGDITPHDGVAPADKRRAEDAAMAELLSEHPALLAQWCAYEAQEDAEARFVRQLDRVDMAAQASVYAQRGVAVDEFFDSAADIVTAPALVALLGALRATSSAS